MRPLNSKHFDQRGRAADGFSKSLRFVSVEMPRLNHLALVATLALCVTLAQCVSGDRIVVTIENNGTDTLLPSTVAPPAILVQDDDGGEEAIPDAIPEQEEAAIISSRRERLVNKVGTRIPERKHRWPEKPTPGRVPAVCAPSNNNKVIIAPYLQSAGSNRMSIRWRTSTTGRSKGVVCFGTNPEDMSTVETAQTRYVTRQVRACACASHHDASNAFILTNHRIPTHRQSIEKRTSRRGTPSASPSTS